ncbi:MAG: AbrB/MazE/SpoVT family DNA-binding domain-containing protein [Acidobacteria bacterium]|nr:AbrB/MazE/SpoVT family DNA-binding domain-containing protein [Acidobacteriota bacterium]
MKTAMDRAGRLVVPKPLRDELGLRAGQKIEVFVENGRIVIQPVPTPMRLVKRGRARVAEAERAMPRLTAAQVRDALDRVRR